MDSIFSISQSALSAQGARMTDIASNLANIDSIQVPGNPAYRALEPVFETMTGTGDTPEGVRLAGTVESNAPLRKVYDPGNPYADPSGYITKSNVSETQQMIDMISASNQISASEAVMQNHLNTEQNMISAMPSE